MTTVEGRWSNKGGKARYELTAEDENGGSPDPGVHIEIPESDRGTHSGFEEDSEDEACCGRTVPIWRLLLLLLAWAFCAVSWTLGLLYPMLTVDLFPGTQFSSTMVKNLLSTLHLLWMRGIYFSFAVLCIASLVIPVVKICGILWLICILFCMPGRNVYETHKCLLALLHYTASYQFLDIYLGLLFACFYNSDAVDAAFGEGFYWFFSYCLVSTMVAFVLEKDTSGQGLCSAEDEDDDDAISVSNASNWSLKQAQSRGGVLFRQTSGSSSANGGGQSPQSRRAGMFSPKHSFGTLSGIIDFDSPQRYDKVSIETPSSMKSLSMIFSTGPGVSYPDPLIVGFFTMSFGIFAWLAMVDPLMEIRMLFNGIAIDRKGLTCGNILIVEIPKLVHPLVVAINFCTVLVLPMVYILSVLVLSICSSPSTRQGSGLQWLKCISGALRGWCHLDVFTIAVFLFLFMVQDPQTVTLIPTGSHSFYFLIGAGWAFFFLKWFSDGEPVPMGSCTRPTRVSWRLLISVGAWLLACATVFGGVPWQIPQNHFKTLDSVCKNTQPLLDDAFRNMPAAIGDCTNKETHPLPPLPCSGHKDLYFVNKSAHPQDHTSDPAGGGYIKAVWLSGLNSGNFTGCQLSRNVTKQAVYSLKISGRFRAINLFIDAKICNGIVGCTDLYSDDHCCGTDINFDVIFEMQCQPGSSQKRQLSNLKIQRCKVDPMFVEERLYGGLVVVDAMDIAPVIESLVADKIQYYMDTVNLTWGGNSLNLAQFVNRLVSYNAPTQDFEC